MKKISAICLALLLFACAKGPVGEKPDQDSAILAQTWRSMLELPGQTGPYRDQLSLRFGKEGDTRRVTAILWGNNEEALRLDVMAGVGAVIAKILENGSHFLVCAPRENKAYFHEGDARPLLKVGVPLPFDLSQLAGLLNGRYAAVFGKDYASAAMGSKGAEYELAGKLAGELLLDENGLPLRWRQKTGGWSLAISYEEDESGLPRRLELNNVNGQRAILLVKEREKPAQAFTAEQMRLEPPPGARLLPLSQFRAAKNRF